MSDRNQQLQFLEDLATQYKFYGDTWTAFLGRFDRQNAEKANNQLRLTWQKNPETPQQKIQDELKKIYPVLRENGCDLPETQRGRYPKGESPWELAYKWLWEVKFPEWQQATQPKPEPTPATLKRCILGLKGSYQEAQQKLREITETLQSRLKDKTLSIAKVEEGSIILIVESSQTGYEQLKSLINQESVAGFQVEYVMDEWQDICRWMLINEKKLTSNTVLSQAAGNRNENRNLIDEDLFVDLALVKPKRSQSPKHPQEIDPERGSDFFTRQEETVEERFTYGKFLEEVIGKRTEKSIAIIGEPGAGKTTLLQKLAFWLLQATDDLVIWVDLAKLGNQDLAEYLEQKWLKKALGQSREEIKGDWEQKIKGGKAWLLLDGLDEMSQGDQAALEFAGWVMNAPMIVTCRLNLWQANPSQLQGFQTYLTQPFQDEQMQEFIQRWFPGLVEKEEGKEKAVQLAESLWSELQGLGKERIKDLCRNPLRLTLLCSTWNLDEVKALPETTAQLYAGFVEAMYAWKKKAFTVKKEEKKQLNAALGALAKASLEAETSRFRLTHRLVCEYLGEPDEDSLFDRALRLGWLNQVGVAAENTRERVYAFYHATFQEYFAACSIDKPEFFLEHIEPQKWRGFLSRSYRIFEKHWKDVFLLWLGQLQRTKTEKDKLIKNLLNFQDYCGGFYKYRAFLLAAEGIAQFPDSKFADEIIGGIIELSFGFRLNIFNDLGIDLVYGYNLNLGNASQIKTNVFWFAIKESATKILLKTNTARVVEFLVDYIKRLVIISDLIDQNFELNIEFLNIKSKLDFCLNFYWITAITDIIDDLIVLEPYFNFFDAQMKENFYTDIMDFFDKNNLLESRMILALGFLSKLGYPNAKGLLTIKYTQKLLKHKNELIRIRAAIVLKELDILEDMVNNCQPNYRFEVMLKIAEIKAKRPANLELDTMKFNGRSVNDFLIDELMKKKHDFQTKLFMQMVIIYVNHKCHVDVNPEMGIHELRKYLRQILSVESFRVLKIESLSMIRIVLDGSEVLGFHKKEIVSWMSTILKSITNHEKCTDENFKDFWEFLPRLNATLWHCAENLPYPQFYQAWHNPLTTHHPEVTEQKQVGHNLTVDSLETQPIDICLQLQNLPIFCLDATILTDETEPSEIAQTLCQLIWEKALSDEDYPKEVTTASKLREQLKTLKLRQNLPKLAILITHCYPSSELIVFCRKLTNIVAIAWLTDEPLEAPLKGFPPNQPHLISAIQTWLEEI